MTVQMIRSLGSRACTCTAFSSRLWAALAGAMRPCLLARWVKGSARSIGPRISIPYIRTHCSPPPSRACRGVFQIIPRSSPASCRLPLGPAATAYAGLRQFEGLCPASGRGRGARSDRCGRVIPLLVLVTQQLLRPQATRHCIHAEARGCRSSLTAPPPRGKEPEKPAPLQFGRSRWRQVQQGRSPSPAHPR
jgi:hypothetical protein